MRMSGQSETESEAESEDHFTKTKFNWLPCKVEAFEIPLDSCAAASHCCACHLSSGSVLMHGLKCGHVVKVLN
jgi:hypothetical protein